MISVLVPFRSDGLYRDKLLSWVEQWWSLTYLGIEFITADTDEPVFNRAAARNAAVKKAHGDVFVFADADTYFEYGTQVNDAVKVARSHGWALPFSDYYTLAEDGLVEHHFPSPQTPEPTVSNPVVLREAYLSVQGYDERFLGWGEEDRAFVYALETLVGPPQRVMGNAYHLWHPAPESERFDQPYFHQNRQLCNRYREAFGNAAQMRTLVDEHALPRNDPE